ncbi:uncharacterized protein FIBRA_08199 [Fibroporia radiculosa]|uniref:CHAT domain-containing protein n=1 Tax=Fibroporia radiculosa TaxID=599839 RepID=J4GWD6_9APHY|nr:uncharacterized protein FIBRA_08199 [Fibroporia radiculosa]CCM05960.1 predicted protein [Fibroporia radiculosa]
MSLIDRFHKHRDPYDMNNAIPSWDTTTQLMAVTNMFGDLNVISAAIEVLEETVGLIEGDNSTKRVILYNISALLTIRFERLSDLDDHPDKFTFLNNFRILLSDRFERLSVLADLDKAISLMEDALRLGPDGYPHKHACLYNIGTSFSSRFGWPGDVADLHKSISRIEDSLRFTPDDHPDRPMYLTNFGKSLSHRFERLGNLPNLYKAISVMEEVLQLTLGDYPQKPGRLNNLANSTSLMEDAVRLTPDGHPTKPVCLNGLGTLLPSQFKRLGDLTDIDDDGGRAASLVPVDHSRKPIILGHLGRLLLGRIERFGNLADIDKSISMMEDALRFTPDDHPDRSAHLIVLGNLFSHRFERLGNLPDLNRLISVMESVLQLIPDGDPTKVMCLDNLGSLFLRRFQRLGDLTCIDKSISVLDEAVQLTPDGDPSKPMYLNGLGASLICRFEGLGDIIDVDKSILVQEDAVRLTPDSHPHKPVYLANLGGSTLVVSFSSRFEQLGDVTDLHKSITILEDALCLAPDGHSGKPSFRFNLGEAFCSSFVHLGDVSALYNATLYLSNAARSSVGSPSERFRASLKWVTCADLVETADVVRDDAAAVALQCGRRDAAIEWLEQGRSVVWNRLLQLRTPLDGLQVNHPALANRLRQVSNNLEQASAHDISEIGEMQKEGLSMNEETRRHHTLALEREKLLLEIRSLPGFERFSLPKTVSQLTSSAHSRPVVVLNANSDDVLHVTLSNNTYKQGFGTRADESQLWMKVTKPVLDALAFSTPKYPSRIFWCPTGPFLFLLIHAAGLYDTAEPGYKLSDFVISSYTPTLGALAPSQHKNVTSSSTRLAPVPQPESDGHSRLPGVQREVDFIRTTLESLPSTPVSLMESNGTVEDALDKMKGSDWTAAA